MNSGRRARTGLLLLATVFLGLTVLWLAMRGLFHALFPGANAAQPVAGAVGSALLFVIICGLALLALRISGAPSGSRRVWACILASVAGLAAFFVWNLALHALRPSPTPSTMWVYSTQAQAVIMFVDSAVVVLAASIVASAFSRRGGGAES